MYADVLVEYSNKSIDKTFTYIMPESLKEILPTPVIYSKK